MTIHLNIGSNLGNRSAMLGRAVVLLREAFPSGHMSISEPYESEPWGFASPHPFLNIGVAITLDGEINPEHVLDLTRGVETSISDASHRHADGSYADRLIDIDIIAIDPEPGRTITYTSDRLILPHPRAHLRPFVLTPLRSLCPTHPLLK